MKTSYFLLLVRHRYVDVSIIFVLLVCRRYVDVSTVDDATSKLIGKRITSTGASFLEVVFGPCHCLYCCCIELLILLSGCVTRDVISVLLLLVQCLLDDFSVGSSFRLKKASRRWTADLSYCR